MTTALAFKHFENQEVEAVVLETGLGGRLDSTNVIVPDVSVITSISLDHTKILGNTVEEIAYEKAGIIKPEIPVVVGPRCPKDIIEEVEVYLKRPTRKMYDECNLFYSVEISKGVNVTIIRSTVADVVKRN